MNSELDCPVCASPGDPFTTHERNGEKWTCLSCRACNSHYWHPRTIRPEFYADSEQCTYDRRRAGESFVRPRHRMFLQRAKPGSLLDIGCGEGTFLSEAQRRGFEVSGLDLDPGNVSVAAARGLSRVRTALLVDTETGQLDPELAAGPRFDWITIFEVLEHQAKPIDFLRGARELLVPGGTLCGSVPNRERLFVDRQRSTNLGDFPPHHYLWFSQHTLAHTLRVAGFKDVRVLPVPEDNVMSYASYLEDALLGGITKRAKKTVSGNGASKKKRSTVMRVARTIKNLPFIPLAMSVRVFMPFKTRTLYFEAK